MQFLRAYLAWKGFSNYLSILKNPFQGIRFLQYSCADYKSGYCLFFPGCGNFIGNVRFLSNRNAVSVFSSFIFSVIFFPIKLPHPGKKETISGFIIRYPPIGLILTHISEFPWNAHLLFYLYWQRQAWPMRLPLSIPGNGLRKEHK